MYKKLNAQFVVRLSDMAFIPNNEDNSDWVSYQSWLAEGGTPEEPINQISEIDKKLAGVEFDGVMCSATAEDQNGLIAVILASQLQGDNFIATAFKFSNGSSINISKENINEFISVWMPFRQSFFLAN